MKAALLTLVLPYDDTIISFDVVNKLDSKGYFIELICSDEVDSAKLINTRINIRQISCASEIEYLNMAIVLAAGQWISLLINEYSINNLQLVIDTAITNPEAVAIAGNKSMKLLEKFGIRDASRTLPIIFDRIFIANFIPLNNSSSLLKILKHSDRLGNLVLLRHYNTTTNYLPKKLVFVRPYLTVARRIYHITARKVKYRIEYKFNHYAEINKKNKLYKSVQDIRFSENIPVFINCRDRYEPLLSLISWLEKEGMKNIILVDNQSSYPPLLEFYKKTNYKVLRLGQNIGHRAPWDSGAINLYAKGKPYIVTDPDVIPDKNSHGAIKYFVKILNKYKEYNKVGFGLRIDNIPDCYDLKENVVQWESKFWEDKVDHDLYDALLDTTFALYRPNTPYTIEKALRTGGKYVAEHEPWYADSSNPSDEVRYYRTHANKDSGTWGLTANDTSKMYI